MRTYPSPSTKKEIQVYVKEIPLTEFPDKYVRHNFSDVYNSGGALFSADIHGMRAWQIEEFTGSPRPKEHPWQEVWYIPEATHDSIIDIIKYTQIYNDKTMDCFKEFRTIVNHLHELYIVRITASGFGGVGVHLLKSPESKQWDDVIGTMYEFNGKFFSTKESKSSLYKRFKKNNYLFFGHC